MFLNDKYRIWQFGKLVTIRDLATKKFKRKKNQKNIIYEDKRIDYGYRDLDKMEMENGRMV